MPQSQPRLAGLILLLTAFAAPAFAQDDPRYALVASFPTPTVSFQWELSDRFALRLDGSYAHRDEASDYVTGRTSFFDGSGFGSSSEITTHTESTITTAAIGLSGIVTVHRTDRMRLYLAPRVLVSFNRQHITETEAAIELTFNNGSSIFGLPTSRPVESKTSSTSPGAGLSFGARSDVVSHVALFGEVGLAYSRSDAPLTGITLPSIGIGETARRSTTVSTRAVAGVMFLF